MIQRSPILGKYRSDVKGEKREGTTPPLLGSPGDNVLQRRGPRRPIEKNDSGLFGKRQPLVIDQKLVSF